jgi:GT2 family glycosyltransferase
MALEIEVVYEETPAFGERRSLPAAALTLICNNANLGFAGGVNAGLRHALQFPFDYFWLLNSDTVAAPGALNAMLDRVRAEPGITMCGSMLLYYDAPEIIEEAGGCAFYPVLGQARRMMKDQPFDPSTDWRTVEKNLGYVSGASCLAPRRVLEDVGLLNEDYFLFGEEIDWVLRTGDRCKLALAPESIVYHKKGRASGSATYGAKRSVLSAYYLLRAKRKLAQRYHPYGLPAIYGAGLAEAVFCLLRGDRRRAKALWAALSGAPQPA